MPSPTMSKPTSVLLPREPRTQPGPASGISPRSRARSASGSPSWPLAVACVGVSLAMGCTALSPAGRGGWSEDERRAAVEKAVGEAPGTSLPAATADAAAPSPEVADAAPAPRRLDLEEALRLAARGNAGIAAADAAVEAAAGQAAVVRAALLPSASARGSYNWYSDALTNSVQIDPSLFPPGTTLPTVTVRQQDFASVGAAVRLAIDASGELRHGLGAAQASYRAEKARAWATRLSEETEVAAAYFGLLEAERLLDVGRATVALHEAQLSDASSRFAEGVITRNQVLVVEVALATSRQALVQLGNMITRHRRALNRAVGLPVDAPTEAVDVAARPPLPPLDQVVAEARRLNPVITAFSEEVQAADERATSARRGRFPRIGASAGYDATTADILQPNDYASVGVGVEMDLLNLAREGEIATADARAKRARHLFDANTREVEALVRDTHDRLRERLLAIDAATVAVRQAEENLRIRRIQFEEGRSTSEDVLDASELATRQGATLAAALYQAHARHAELMQLAGSSPAAGLGSTASGEAR